MQGDRKRWQSPVISDEMVRKAEERRKLLNEMEELKEIEMPIEKLEDIHRELERRKAEKIKRMTPRARIRPSAVLVAVLVLVLGLGGISSGNKLYQTEVSQSERGNETTSNIENTDSIDSGYDEIKVCQEIQEKLGVLPVMLSYRPKDMILKTYTLIEKTNEVILSYKNGQDRLNIYIAKDYQKSSTNFQVDGELIGNVFMENSGIEVPMYLIKNEQNEIYCSVEFEYLNTYYSITGSMEVEEFKKIIENILIKNV